MRVSAGIVTYNPDISLLKENVNSIKEQVDKVVICDNNSNNIRQIEELLDENDIELVKLNENKGIAAALNDILNWCFNNGYEWVLTLDQDSTAKQGLINEYLKYLETPNVAIMTCDLCSKEEQKDYKKKADDFDEIEECYTSGSFCKVENLLKVGAFDEKMFIDYVDFDMCLTLLENGYRIIKINYLGLIHEVGQTKVVKFLGRKEKIFNHPSFRKYYMSRNGIYFARKHKKFFGIKRFIKKILSVYKRRLLVFIFEKHKMKNWFYGLKGTIVGYFMKIE